ncbi:MAG TPA: DJ-1/PfpI family protein [Azospirillaceae bacterium]|nr:DJ-1/PfpI family protein [Azospirillaceae bacterium]
MGAATWAQGMIAVAAVIGMASGGSAAVPDGSARTSVQAAASPDALAVPAPKAGRGRHLVAILADNEGTETTDFIVPFGVLKESGVARVVAVSTGPGTVALMPALRAKADLTTSQFDAENPGGADILIVPAMHTADKPAVVAWIRAQAAKGAVVVAICAGAATLGHAGLLDGRAVTTHWYMKSWLARRFPAARVVDDRRYVQDGPVVSTSGVTASIPVSLALVEAMAGRSAAAATAHRLGISGWSAGHASARFSLKAGHVAAGLWNLARFWSRERVDIPVADGFDEIAVALAADAWSQTYRSRAHAVSPEWSAVFSRRGLVILTDGPDDRSHVVTPPAPSGTAVDRVLADIAHRYGRPTADLVVLHLEYAAP